MIESGHDSPTSLGGLRAGGIVSFRIADSLADLYVMGNVAKTSTTIDKAGLSLYKQGLSAWSTANYFMYAISQRLHIISGRMFCSAVTPWQ